MRGARSWIERNRLLVSLALFAYLPLLLTAPGRVPGDTKLYLYLDPWRLMSDAAYSWDSRQFGGWVPHQNVGYLWPSGPWFGLFDLVGAPDWVAHRLWMATLLFVAGAGIVHLGRRFGLSPVTVAVAAFAYQFSPYVLPYISRTSALLLPWALLGWIVAATHRFTLERRWSALAVFALLILSSGGLNATALLVIAPGPIAVIVDAAWRRRVSIRSALISAGTLGLTAIVASAWWLAGLVVQGRHGSAVLSYTEALPSTAATSTAPEVLRGLGYWLFYDRNDVVPLTSAASVYQTNPVVIVVGAMLVLAGMWGLRSLSSSVRRTLASMLVAGVVLAVGAHPYSSPSPAWSRLVDDPRGALSLALRSSTRAVPLIAMALAFGLGRTVDSLRRRALDASRPRWAAGAVPLAVALVMINLPALWTGRLVDPVMERPESIPTAWTDAAGFLDERFDGGRRGAVLILPGIESAAFRWGYPVDPILPGLTKKPMLNRDWVPQGSAPHMDLLYALDDSFQNGTADPRSIAPIARLLGADTVMVVNSYQYERFGLDAPGRAASLIDDAPDLVRLAEFGEPVANVAPGDDVASDPLPEIVLYEVSDPTSGYRYSDTPVVVSGDGTSLVDVAAGGLIDGRSLVLHSAALDDEALSAALSASTELIVTDGNRKRAHHWRGSQDVWGATETPDDPPEDEFDNRLPVFPAAVDAGSRDARLTTVDTSMGPTVTATAYGALLAYYPEYRPAMAVDGDPETSWLVGWGRDPVGQILEIRSPARPIETLRLQPAHHPSGVRPVTRASISVDGEAWSTLDPASLDDTVSLPRAATWLRLRIDAVEPTRDVDDRRPSGWADVLSPDDSVVEYLATPTDAVDVVGSDTPVSYRFARLRADDTDPERADPERAIHRIFHVEHDDGFVVSATARLNDGETTVGADCRDDLLTLDFEPVLLRVAAVDGSEVRLEACEPLLLGPGSRILSSASDSPIVIDAVTLRSARATSALPVTSVAVDTTRTSRTAEVPICASDTCWIESTDGWNTGWSATLAGETLDAPVASAAGRGTWTLVSGQRGELNTRWTPQRLMWIGIVVSAVAAIAALVVLAVGCASPTARRRTMGRTPEDSPPRANPTTRRHVVAALVCGAVVAIVVHPLAGALVAAVTMLERRETAILDHVLVGLVGLGYAYVVIQQVRYGTPHGFGWPGAYGKVHGVVMLGTVAYALRLARDRTPVSGRIPPS